MGRKKKTVVELEAEVSEDTATESESTESEWESEEAEALATEEATEETAEAKEEESKDEEKEEVAAAEEKPAPKKRRRSRKPKLAAVEATDPQTPEPSDSDDNDLHIREDAAVASVSMQKSMDTMVKQWGSIKDISSTIATNFDRIHKNMNDLQANYSEALEKLSRQVPAKPAPLTKMAMAVSVFSVVVSLLSFSFAQSVRSSMVPQANRLSQSMPQAQQPTQTAHENTAPAPEIAFGASDSAHLNNPTAFPSPLKRKHPTRLKK